MFFGYGNGTVESKIAVQAFNLSDPSFNDIDEQGAQIGISQAFVSVTPDVTDIIDNCGLNVRVGAFWNQYGGAGKYDAGAYDAYIIGRTHIIGGTYRVDFDFDDGTLWIEHGVGTKQPARAYRRTPSSRCCITRTSGSITRTRASWPCTTCTHGRRSRIISA